MNFSFPTESWHTNTLTYSLFPFSHFSRDSKEDQSHHLRCQTCWSKRLDRSPFSTSFLIRLFIRDQTQATESIGNSQAMNPFFWLFALLALLPLVSAMRTHGIVIRLPQPDGRVLHRSKRDWMWRQFFLSEEYTGSNYQYVGKVSDGTLCTSFVIHPHFHPQTLLWNWNWLPNKALRGKMWRNEKSALRFIWHDIIFEYGYEARPLSKQEKIKLQKCELHSHKGMNIHREAKKRERKKGWQKKKTRAEGWAPDIEGEYFVPGVALVLLFSFLGQSGSRGTWQESTITGYFILFLDSLSPSLSPFLSSDFLPICSACVKGNLQFIKLQFRGDAKFMPH